jgi:hypothetical protein
MIAPASTKNGMENIATAHAVGDLQHHGSSGNADPPRADQRERERIGDRHPDREQGRTC